MPEKTAKDMTRELYQAVIGIPESPDDNGLIGIVNGISEKLDIVNGRTRKNEVRSKVNQAIIALIVGGSGLTAVGTKIAHLW